MVATPIFNTSLGDMNVQSGVLGSATRSLPLTDAKADSGIPLTAAAGTPTGAVGVSRTAGTSLVLVGEATSSSAKTNKALWEITVPPTYNGAAFNVVASVNYTGSGTVTAASTTIALAVYSQTDGVEAAISGITAAQQITGTAVDYMFVVPANAAVVANRRIILELTLVVTTSAGAATGQINRITVQM